MFGRALLLAASAAAAPPFINPGTPNGIPDSYNCEARKHAWEFGKKTLPSRGDFRTLFDALQLQACGLTPPSVEDKWAAPTFPTPASGAVYADASAAPGGDGSKARPFSTLAAAVDAAEGKQGATVLLRKGTYHTGQIVLGAGHSGLTVQNYAGEEAVVSGAVPVRAPGSGWKPYRVVKGEWRVYDGQNNVFGAAQSRADTDTIKYLGDFDALAACESAAASSAKGPFPSLTYHQKSHGGEFARQCFGTTTAMWAPTPDNGVVSVRNFSQNTWRIDLSGQNVTEIPGLRVNGQRAIRAKYPDGNPELSGQYFFSSDPGMGSGKYQQGWVTSGTKWAPPRDQDAKWAATKDVVVNGKDWPSVEWPLTQEGGSSWTGEGDWGDYHVGMGGFCDDISPPYGYWCSQKPPRGNCYDAKKKTSRGCTQTHMAPSGVYANGVLPHAANYSDPKGAVVQVWRGGGRWFTNLCLVDGFDKQTGLLSFDAKVGCNQGGEGEVGGNEWWIENVKEECDSDGEYFYDAAEQALYYNFNGTAGPGGEDFAATRTKVLFNVSGTQASPVRDVTIRGLTLRDTALTYLGTDVADVHGMPSGGDWALQRSGAVLLEGTERVTVDQCLLTRIDGNGIFLSNYNRNATISGNELSWVGDSAMAAWGSTGQCLNEACSQKVPWGVGPDGRGGDQPRGTHVVNNLVREIGIWQKQSSMWFQAVTARTHFEGNVHFNGPRAGLNFNDGFGGGDVIEGNLITNCVRESGDHGPWNSWDRVPYITDIGMHREASRPKVGDGMPGHVPSSGPSVIPTFREIRHNFIFSLYSSQEAIDTDDGSSYYQTHDNYFIYASGGLKSDFGGQWNHHFRNVYAYVGGCFGSGGNLAFYDNICQTRGGYGRPSGTMTTYGNKVHTESGSVSFPKGDNSTAAKYLSDAQLTAAGTAALHPFPKA